MSPAPPRSPSEDLSGWFSLLSRRRRDSNDDQPYESRRQWQPVVTTSRWCTSAPVRTTRASPSTGRRFRSSGPARRSRQFVTSAAGALVRGVPVRIRGGRAALTVPARSVTAFLIDEVHGVARDAALVQPGRVYRWVRFSPSDLRDRCRCLSVAVADDRCPALPCGLPGSRGLRAHVRCPHTRRRPRFTTSGTPAPALVRGGAAPSEPRRRAGNATGEAVAAAGWDVVAR